MYSAHYPVSAPIESRSVGHIEQLVYAPQKKREPDNTDPDTIKFQHVDNLELAFRHDVKKERYIELYGEDTWKRLFEFPRHPNDVDTDIDDEDDDDNNEDGCDNQTNYEEVE